MWGFGPGYMMGGWGHGGFGMIFPLIILIALIAGAVWAIRNFASGSSAPAAPRGSPALDVLEERYARGEIERDEFMKRKTDLAR